MDGHFVPNITMGPPILSCVRDNVPNIFMDCHMMVSDPAKVGGGVQAKRQGGSAESVVTERGSGVRAQS